MSDARMPEDTPTGIADVLAHYAADCPALHGAVVATHDGLVLGATPSFEGDTPAAAAASLSVHLEQDLTLLMPAQVHECLLWADVGVWYMCRLANGHVLLAHAADGTLAGALRLAGQIAAAQLAPLLPQDA
jgi:predicted regulator of Ras-like GTPase activity (Roadblock/LC7/MglB family)